ncbi:MAG: ribosome assembly factor SBDS [Candidatus Aenigmarchaeota archaeon]|nr:ribosome assembly factor SBDS [Candidatus Aenigmarchaeota archaeon]
MVTVDKAVIAKIEKNGKIFEILVDPELAYAFRDGKAVSIANMLAVDDVFKDSKKGMPAARRDVIDCFGTDNIEDVAKEILKKGDIQLTTEFRKKKLEEKKKQIADFISKNVLDPKTKKPHPQQRILNAMDRAKVHVDVFKNVNEQINDVIKAIREVIPISFEKIRLDIKVPPKWAGKCYGVIKSFGTEPQWMKDGSLSASMEISPGLKQDIFNKLNNITRGEVKISEK